MAEQAMPNVVGKGPSLIRETVAVLKEVQEAGSLSGAGAEKIKTVCSGLVQEIEPLVSRAYIRTVKAAEMAWQCNQIALKLKDSVASGDEAAALTATDEIGVVLGDLINKTKSFVIRMT